MSYVLDEFDRTSGPGGLGTADTLHVWTDHIGSWFTDSTGDGTATRASFPEAVSTIDCGEADHTVTVTLRADVGAGTSMGVMARYSDESNYWYAFTVRRTVPVNPSYFVLVGRREAGTSTPLAELDLSTVLAFPEEIQLRIHCEGDLVGWFVRQDDSDVWTHIHTEQSTFNQTATRGGIRTTSAHPFMRFEIGEEIEATGWIVGAIRMGALEASSGALANVDLPPP